MLANISMKIKAVQTATNTATTASLENMKVMSGYPVRWFVQFPDCGTVFSST
jgi:hypothetical protein